MSYYIPATNNESISINQVGIIATSMDDKLASSVRMAHNFLKQYSYATGGLMYDVTYHLCYTASMLDFTNIQK